MFVPVYHSYKSTTAPFPKQLQSVLHVQIGVLKHQFLFLPASIKSQEHIITSKVFSPIIIIHYVVNRLVVSVNVQLNAQCPSLA